MSETEAYTHFVEPMRRRFTVPSGIDPDLFSADLAEALANYTVYQLKCAAIHFRDHRTQRSFPTIAECKQTCERYSEVEPVEAQGAGVTGRFETDAMRKSLDHTYRTNRLQALRLCRCALGRQAHEEGWLGRLIEFATDNQRLPEGREIQAVKAEQQRADASLERLRPPVKGSHWSLAEQAELFRKMSDLRQAFIEKAYNDVFGWVQENHKKAANF